MSKQDLLLDELDKAKTNFKAESYSMSVGELTNLYLNNEIVIRPEYQRLFRWTHLQKVKLIESILLGIPIPTVFVYQNKDGVWELVDGLQRVSTILQFMGVLKEKEKLTLRGTKYLPSLDGFSWENENEILQLSDSLKLAFRRSKLNFTIILSESDPKAKFEVFQRLNTGGSQASPQEIRNNIMIMINPDKYNWFKELSDNPDFQSTLSLTDRLTDEQYHMELLLRFIALSNFSYDSKKDVGDFLDEINDKLLEEDSSIDFGTLGIQFKQTFQLLNRAYGDKVFKKNFAGKFLESSFEAITIGLVKNISNYDIENEEHLNLLKTKIENLYNQDFYISNAGSGSNAKTRINRIIPESINYFKNEPNC